MTKKKEDELLDSYYDGIEEYDNDLPRWWLWLFYITIIISPIYVWYYHMGPGLQPSEELAVDMKELQEIRARYAQQASAGGVADTEESLRALASDQGHLATGSKIFQEKCLPCHGAKGEGLIGPNLTDANWIHGGDALQIKQVIENGVLAKGMVAWKETLKPDEIRSVVAFLWSIRNTNVPGKAAEGTPVS